KWTPRQAILAWFNPLFTLFQPYQVMKALYGASDPSALADVPAFRDRAAPNYREGVRELLPPQRWDHAAPIAAWWGAFNLRWIWSIGAGNAPTPAAFGGSMAIEVVAAILCVLVIRSVDARQRERYRRLEASWTSAEAREPAA